MSRSAVSTRRRDAVDLPPEIRPTLHLRIWPEKEAADADHPNKRVRGISRHLIGRAEALLLFAEVPGVSPPTTPPNAP